MFELLIGAFILFIVSVGSTIIYDKYKNPIKEFLSRRPQPPKQQVREYPSESFNEINKEFVAEKNRLIKEAASLPTRSLKSLNELMESRAAEGKPFTARDLKEYILEHKNKKPRPKSLK